MKRNGRTFLLAWAALFFAVSLILLAPKEREIEYKEVSFNEFVEKIKEKKLSNVTIVDEETMVAENQTDGKKTHLKTTTDTRSDFYKKLLIENGVVPKHLPKKTPSTFFLILMNWMPIFLFFGIIWFMMKKAPGMGGKNSVISLDVAASRKNPTGITFNDVAGVDEAKAELVEVVDFLKDPKKFTTLGGRLPKGVLLIGPPGTGKTMLAKATANQAGVPFFSISGSNFVELFVGVGASRVRTLFEQARKSSPCIIFIDEIDSIGKSRGSGSMMGSNDEREQTLNQLLVELDGFESSSGIILIGATNRVDTLDPALLRPGRFDRRIYVSLPDVKGREQILGAHCRKIKLSNLVDLKITARGTPGFSGAELENLVNEAAILAARSGRSEVLAVDLDNAKDKVMMGLERKSMVISDKDKRVTAYHEIGHVLIGKLIPGSDPIHKVTIIPRGQALGVTQTLPEDNALNYSKEKLEGMICMLLGGRVAESIIFDQITTGASNDLERVARLARKMVCDWGMTEKFGATAFPNLVDRGFGETHTFSPETLKMIDEEIISIIKKCQEKTNGLLQVNKNKLIVLSEKLIEKETLSSEEIDNILNS